MSFVKAQKKKLKLRLWLNGMSESGKSLSALKIAAGIGGPIAVIDTEAGRGNTYADEFEYDIQQINKPFTPEKYIKALAEAEDAGYNVIIIDSTSHVWQEVLEIKGKLDEKGGNNYTNWAGPTRRYNQFLERINQSPCHIIATSRVKRDHILEEDENGKKKPRYVGLANIMRDGSEYDMTCEFRIGKDHRATPVKDNTRIFTQRDSEGVLIPCEPFLITEKTGGKILDWLNDGMIVCRKCEKEGKTVEATAQVDEKDFCGLCLEEYNTYKQNLQIKKGEK